ncbi:MAG: chitobiase/beta-hexosaminidase C-terminal domain-containing protein [Candidatus Obscuribacter sp.]|nr:chitobiase/beta-hexosaminidase C-terminal domain-containing protein [Candidatus Obscuribacter sp.]MBK9277241.1 chitobiase/beta-hexosaminidase C-terminal domain-containing protein [Candidatus Obscuribacter sp.]
MSTNLGSLIKFHREIQLPAISSMLGAVIISVALILCFMPAAHATDAPNITPGTGVYSTVQSTATITAQSGATIYYTVNGSQPDHSSTVYSAPISLSGPVTIKALAYLSGVDSTVTTANIQSDPNTLPVPRNGLSLWLKSDFGLSLSGTAVTGWSDLSGATTPNDASQATSGNRPAYVSSAINGFPGVSFNGTSQYLTLANGLTDLTSGFACFGVLKPAATSAGTVFYSGSSGPSDTVSLQTNNSQATFTAYNGSTSSSLSTGSSALTFNKFQTLDAVHSSLASASMTVNSVQAASGTVQNLANVSRTLNFVGSSSTSSGFWTGEIAELLVYSRTVTTSEQAAIEAYLASRYQINTAISTPDPVLSVGTSTLTGPTEVAIASVDGASVYYTLDGSTPDPSSSPSYTGPVNIAYSQTLKAIAVVHGIQSSVVSATYTLDSTKWPAPSSSDTRPLQLNLQLPTTAIPQ